MSAAASWRIIITGCIQGIGFRPFVFRVAHEAGVKGNVANLGDGRVEINATGTVQNLNTFKTLLKTKKPELAVYDTFKITKLSEVLDFDTFQIKKSRSGNDKPSASYIPPDLSICDECIEEIRNKSLDRRYHYPFTSCVNCGPRYTIIHELPYDRPLTEMKHFPFCDECLEDYKDPFDRRFHAQTTCCTKCGPHYTLYEADRDEPLNIEDRISFVAQQIKNGKIIAIKGIGGTHLACDPFNDEAIHRLRTRKGERKEKPFALMAVSIEEIKKHAYVSPRDENALTSLRRPIIILDKKPSSSLSELVSPNLHNVGIMLPYSGLHYLLLWSGLPILIMTSANISHQPMLIDNDKIKQQLQSEQLADYFLLHDRTIYQRCDDSVIRSYNTSKDLCLSHLFIRRSRGYTPEPLDLPPSLGKEIVLGTGAEMHTTAAIAVQGKIFQTQYLGTVSYYKNWLFWKQATQHIQHLLHAEHPSLIACDLHPDYETTHYAEQYTQDHNIELTQVQHHHAHAASIMVENELGLDDIILTVALDGMGYGSDGTIWGGEILKANYKKATRLASVKPFPQPGGDLATKYPIRSAIGILYGGGWEKDEVYSSLKNQIDELPNGKQEYDVLWQQLQKGINSPLTSSTGRILDAAAAILGITRKQTYEGSPAIQLESAGIPQKNNIVSLETSVEDNYLWPVTLLQQLITERDNYSRAKLAASFQTRIAKDFANLAHYNSQANGLKYVGLSGGVAINYFIRKYFHKQFLHRLLEQKLVPSGDGGVSVGQCAVGLARLQDRIL